MVEAYQKAGVARGKLEQSDIICRAPFETWFCLSVESDNAGAPEHFRSFFSILAGIHHDGFPFVGGSGKICQLLLRDSNSVTFPDVQILIIYSAVLHISFLSSQ